MRNALRFRARHRLVGVLALAAVLSACAPPPARYTSGAVTGATTAADVVAEVNRARRASGLGPLASSAPLASAALVQARHAASVGRLTHRSAGGGTVMRRVRTAGYPACLAAENLSAGQRGAGEVVAGWMSSPGHRRNILVPSATHAGAASATTEEGVRYWTLVVARPC